MRKLFLKLWTSGKLSDFSMYRILDMSEILASSFLNSPDDYIWVLWFPVNHYCAEPYSSDPISTEPNNSFQR